MEKEFNTNYRVKYNQLIKNDCDLLTAAFAYGVGEGCRTLLDPRLITNPMLSSFRHEWRYDLFRKIQIGKDSLDNEEIDIPDGILYLVNSLNQAIKFNRPAWGFFYLLGLVRGYFNSGEIKPTEFQHAYTIVPLDFAREYKQKVEYLSNYFDEVGFLMEYIIESDVVMVGLSRTQTP